MSSIHAPPHLDLRPGVTPEASRRLVAALAWITRRFHPRGVDRCVRLLHPPGNLQSIQAVIDYDEGLRLHIDTRSFCEWYIYFYGAFRPRVSRLLNRMLQSGHVAFDIGANIGMHSVIMANRVGPSGRVVSFEPDPHPYARLQANLGLNGFTFVETHQAALSSRTEKRKFYLHDENIGNFANASLHAENVGATTEAVEVDVLSLDGFVAHTTPPRLDVIKLLAQGEEWNILQGSRETIAKYRPAIFFLYEPIYWQRQGRELMDAVRFFSGYNYTTWTVEFGRRRVVSEEIPFGQVFLAAPAELRL